MTTARTPATEQQDGVTVIALGPEYESLDEHLLDDLRTALLSVAQQADPPLIVLDLSHTRFFGSAFLEVLFRMWNCLREREDGRLCISGLTPYCREVLEVTHLDSVWQICETRDEAVQLMRNGTA